MIKGKCDEKTSVLKPCPFHTQCSKSCILALCFCGRWGTSTPPHPCDSFLIFAPFPHSTIPPFEKFAFPFAASPLRLPSGGNELCCSLVLLRQEKTPCKGEPPVLLSKPHNPSHLWRPAPNSSAVSPFSPTHWVTPGKLHLEHRRKQQEDGRVNLKAGNDAVPAFLDHEAAVD